MGGHELDIPQVEGPSRLHKVLLDASLPYEEEDKIRLLAQEFRRTQDGLQPGGESEVAGEEDHEPSLKPQLRAERILLFHGTYGVQVDPIRNDGDLGRRDSLSKQVLLHRVRQHGDALRRAVGEPLQASKRLDHHRVAQLPHADQAVRPNVLGIENQWAFPQARHQPT